MDIDEGANGIRAVNGGFYSQVGDGAIDVLVTNDNGGPYQGPSDTEVLGGSLLRRKGEWGRRKLVRVKHLRPNEVKGSLKHLKDGKLRQKVLRRSNTKVARIEVNQEDQVGESNELRRGSRTRVLRRRRPSRLESIEVDRRGGVRVGGFLDNINKVVMSEERESENGGKGGQEEEEVRGGKYELGESLRRKEGRKMVKGRGRVLTTGNKTNLKGRKVIQGEGRNVIRGETGRVRKVVRKKKVRRGKFGGRRIDSGEEKKEKKYEKGEEGVVILGIRGKNYDGVETRINDRNENEGIEGNEEGGRLKDDLSLRRKVRRKTRRRERVENSGSMSRPPLDEASLKNLARQEVSSVQEISSARRVNTFPSTNSAIRSTTPKPPTTAIQQVFIYLLPFCFKNQ